MSLPGLFDDLEAAGITLWLDDGRLRFRAPKGALTADLRARIGAHKPAIITALTPTAGGGIPRVDGREAPLSFAQRRLWFLGQLGDAGGVYNMPGRYRLTGPLHAERLFEAFSRLEARHAVMRTTFARVDGEPRQRIGPPTLAPRLVDLTDHPAPTRAAGADRVAREAAGAAFDLSRGPLWSVTLVRLDPELHELVLVLHHIIADGWSVGLLFAELVALYTDPRITLPALPIRYADFAAWQAGWLDGPEMQAHAAWWIRQLAGAPPLLALPTDHPRPAVQRDRGAHVAFALPPALTAGLDALARRSRATLFMTLQTAFAVLLSRWSGQTDVLVGTPIANRAQPEVEPLIGLFLNALVLRNDLSGAPTFIEALARTRDTALDAFDHQALPFEMLVEAVRPERSMAYSPVFQVMFNLINTRSDAWALPGVEVEVVDLDYPVAKHDVILTMQARGDALHGLFEYNTDLFERPTIARMAGHLRTLLDAVVADPDRPIDALPLLTAAEHHRWVVEWNDRPAPRPAAGYHALFARQAARAPDATAVVEHSGGARYPLTYGALGARADRLAASLRAAGVIDEAIVGVCLPRSVDTLASMLAIFAAGGAYMPLDPSLPDARLHDMIERAGAPVVIAAPEDAERFAGRARVVDPAHAPAVDAPVPAGDRGPGALAYVLFTSGSTGRPKAVMVEHRGLVNNLYAKIEDHGLDTDSRLAQTAPVSFDISVWQLLAAPLCGGAVHIFEDDIARDPARLLGHLRAEAITHAEIVPSFFRFVLDEIDPAEPKLPALRWLSLTGEALPPELCRRWFALCPGVPILNAYGPAECSDDATHHIIREAPAPGARAMAIGEPIPNARVYVLDPARQPVPVGVPGELYVGGVGVGRGYLGEPERTAAVFVDDPFSDAPDGRMYRTGDEVRRRADGALAFVGRLDHQVKLRGVRIELGEVEARLKQHPTVRDAVALVDTDGGEQHLVAHVVLSAAGVAEAARAMAGRVDQWTALHDQSYTDTALLDDDPTLDVIGWDSMYDNQPLPAAEMRAYIDGAVQRALAHRPADVLEVGCGTGLLAFRMIPRVERYLGVDISAVAVDRLRAIAADPTVAARIAGLDHAAFAVGSADALDALPPGRFDLAMLPSVVQYFPDVAYLDAALGGLVDRVRDGGIIFVGDVRHLGLLPAFIASVQCHRAAPGEANDTIRRRTLRALHAEQELAIDPRAFARFAAGCPRVSHVELLPKAGRHANEMTRFRYDVRLRVGGPAPAPYDGIWHDMASHPMPLDAIERILRDASTLALTRVANARVRGALDDLRRLDLDAPGAWAPTGARALEPADLWDLAARTGHRAIISLAAGHPGGAFDVLFTRAGGPIVMPTALELDRRLVNLPALPQRAQALAPVWRAALAEQLPAYMVPDHCVVHDALPVNANGKIDRRRLPPPPERGARAPADDRDPTPTEAALIAIWQDVLPVDRVGPGDDFFDRGGHSLLATVLVSRVRRALDVELPLRQIFDTPTVAGLAGRVDALRAAPAGGSPAAMPIAAGPRPETLPLSFSQQRLWFLTRLEGPSARHNLPNGIRLRGTLDVEALIEAWRRIEAHHESLRTTFHAVDGRPEQRVGSPRFELVRHDLSAVEAPAGAIERIVADEATRVFDLEAGPLWRVALVRLAVDAHVLLVTMHHIISDGWSMAVLTEAFSTLYPRLARGLPVALDPLPVQYPDFAIAQRAWLAGEARAASVAYWRARLQGAPPTLDLPTDRARPAEQGHRGDWLHVTLPPALVTAVERLARRQGATLFMALEAAFAVLLARYAEQDDVCVGTPIANRQSEAVEGLVGLFVNTLVLRNDLSGAPGFSTLLGRVREAALGAYQHQALPFDLVVEALQPARSLSHSPLFQVLFALQNEPRGALDLGGLAIEDIDARAPIARFDLTLIVQPVDDAHVATWTWRTDLFDRSTVDAMARRYVRLLDAIVAAPKRCIWHLDMASAASLRPMVGSGVDAIHGSRSAVERFTAQMMRAPDRVAVACGATTLTYRALHARARRLAAGLVARGVTPGAVVAVCLPRGADAVVALWATWMAGATWLPLEPGHPAARLAFVLDDARPALVLVAADGPLAGRPTATVDAVLAGPSSDTPLPEVRPDQRAYVIYTSGSTGQPKGVEVGHRALAHYLAWCTAVYPLVEGAGVPVIGALGFDGTLPTVVAPLLVGQRVIVVPEADAQGRGALEIVGEMLAATDAPLTLVKGTPTHLTLLADMVARRGGRARTRAVLAGGEALPGALVAAWRALAPGCRVFNQYGPTEAAVAVTVHEVGPDVDPAATVPIGRPAGANAVHLLDPRGRPVPPGVPGEIHIGGPQLAVGYLGRPALTAERFVDGARGRLYRTGDRARVRPTPDGPALEFLGRVDDQLKINGVRIEPGEIVAALRALPGVEQAAVIAGPGPRGPRLVAYIVGAGAPDDDALRGGLAERLPGALIPAVFVRLAALPRTTSGKLDARALPPPDKTPNTAGPVAPRTADEATLAAIWREVLGDPTIGVTDNFFRAGGDSIISIQVVSRARRAGLLIEPRQLFEHQTIAALVRAARRRPAVTAAPDDPVGPFPLLPAHLRFFDQGWAEPDHYTVPLVAALADGIEPAWVEQALAAVVAHHAALRSRAVTDGGRWRAETLPAGPETSPQLDVIDDPAPDALAAHVKRLNRSLDLARGPIVRAALVRGGTDHLIVAIHHLAVDGFSCRIVLEDLDRALAQRRRGEPIALPATGTSLRRWAHLLHREGPTIFAAERAHWARLHTLDVPPLPVDHGRGPDDIQSMDRVTRALDPATTDALLRAAPAVYHARVDDLLVTALALTLRRWSGHPTALVELQAHGRQTAPFEASGAPDLSRTVGWLANAFPVDITLPDEDTADAIGHAILAVKERLRSVPNRGIGHGILARENPGWPGRWGVGAEVHFNYIGQFAPVRGGGPIAGLVDGPQDTAESPTGTRLWPLDINAVVVDGRLEVHWFYSQNRHRQDTVAALADGLLDTLRAVIEHCQAPGAGGHSPSDFPDAWLDQATLDRVLDGIRAHQDEPSAIEALYPLTAPQSGMLVETLAAPGRGVHIEQSTFTWRGALDRRAFAEAWARVQARHATLRTGFAWQAGPAPLQFVAAQAPVPIAYRRLDAGIEATVAVARFARADRDRGFDLARAPLMRLTVFEAASGAHHIVWTRHHAVTDGWSIPIVVDDFMAAYRAARAGVEARRPPTRPYRDYVAWWAQRSVEASADHWRARLAGVGPTPIGHPPAGAPRAPGVWDGEVPRAATAALRDRIRARGLTFNALIRAAWALTLGRHAGATDVVFGTTVSGRPAGLDGVEEIVGLFVNTLPARVDLNAPDDLSVIAWLEGVQRRSAEQQAHAHCTSGQIDRWIGRPAGAPLYESLLVVENQPDTPAQRHDGPVVIDDVRAVGAHTRFALTGLVFPDEALGLRLVYDPRRLSAGDVDALGADVVTALGMLADGSNAARPARAVFADFDHAGRAPRSTAATHRPAAVTEAAFVAPRTDLEQRLARIWQEALGLPATSVRADFFALGGDSLGALRVSARIGEHLGVELPLSTLLSCPTIEQLAARLDDPATAADWSPLVPLRTAGAGRPLFCLPGGGGNVLYLHGLARALGDACPIYALQAVGLDGETPPHATVEAIARHHIAAIRAVQPQGPYLLGGHSFGGLVAYEMARQLTAAGEAVERVLLLDTTVPVARPESPLAQWDEARWSVALAETFAEMSGRTSALDYPALAALPVDAQRARFRDELERLELLPVGADLRHARGWLRVFRANLSTRYLPEPGLSAPVTLFRAEEALERDPALEGHVDAHRGEVDMGWSTLVGRPVEVVSVPGDHLSMMRAPHVRVLAERLAACLAREAAS